MTKKLLVTYASPHGSTAEVATFAGHLLNAYDVEIDVKHADEVTDVSAYDAFILGSAVHASMWLPSISRLMFRFEKELSQKPIYLFMMCIIVLEEGGREKALETFVWKEALERLNLSRDNIEVFAGRLDWSQTSGDERWMISTRYEGNELPGRNQADYRDWQAIAAWFHKIANDLELPINLSEAPIAPDIKRTTKDETMTREDVDNLTWADNPGEVAPI
ncbi:MAG: flavodoxin domain-containing protein [Chloroflexota bacterium]